MSIVAGYHASKYGKTTQCDFITVTPTRYQLLTNLVAGPVLFMLKATQRCYFRPGVVGVLATAYDFDMDADKEYPYLIETIDESYISIFGITASGYLKATETSRNLQDASILGVAIP